MSLRPRARIHLNHIAENWRTLQQTHQGGTVAAVVKADAYGHGLKPVCEALHAAGCDHFFTAHAFEAEMARKTLGPHPEIYVLNGPAAGEEDLYRQAALTPIINSQDQYRLLCEWVSAGRKLSRGYALHFDTGIHRLGLNSNDAAALAEATQPHPPKLILSHFACADEAGASMNSDQASLLDQVAAHFPNLPLSLSNSSGVWLDPSYHLHLSRPGLALYGGGHPPPHITLKPGLTLEAPILQILNVPAGASVGYGATWQAPKETLLATLALGYGDGFPRSASNRGFASLNGQRCPIRGRISMDLMTIEISSMAGLARPGDYVQLIGADAPLEEQAGLAGALGYELTTGLTPRVSRIYETD